MRGYSGGAGCTPGSIDGLAPRAAWDARWRNFGGSQIFFFFFFFFRSNEHKGAVDYGGTRQTKRFNLRGNKPARNAGGRRWCFGPPLPQSRGVFPRRRDCLRPDKTGSSSYRFSVSSRGSSVERLFARTSAPIAEFIVCFSRGSEKIRV